MEKTTQNTKSPLCAADFRRMAREALKGKWKKGFFFFLLSHALVNALGLSIVQEHFFTGSTSAVPGLDMFENIIFGHNPEGFGWALAVPLAIWSFINGFLYVGQQRLCIRALDGEELQLKQLLPAKLFGKAAVMGGLRAILLHAPGLLIVVIDILLTVRLSGPLAALGIAVSLPLLLGFIIWVSVVSFGLRMSDYLMAKDASIGPISALRESWQLMRGKKWKKACLNLSFTGWIILSLVPGWLLKRIFPMESALVGKMLLWLVNLAASAALMLYISVAETAFYRDMEKAQTKDKN